MEYHHTVTNHDDDDDDDNHHSGYDFLSEEILKIDDITTIQHNYGDHDHINVCNCF